MLGHTCANVDQVTSSLPTCTDSFAFRGKICSLLDASATTAAHVGLLLSDAAAVCGRKSNNSTDDLKASAQKLQQQLAGVVQQLGVSTGQLQSALLAKPLASTGTLNMQLTQLQKQLASTAALDGCLRAVGTAYASLLGLSHREGAAVARQFLQDAGATGSSAGQPAGGSAAAGGVAPAAVASKVLKLGDCAMKRLRNGDIYKVGAVFALGAGLQELRSCSPTCAAGLLMIQTPRGAPALSSEKLHATHTAFWPRPQAQQKQGRLLCCRAATRACTRMGRAATASSTGMSLRESSGTTAWLAQECTASRLRAGERLLGSAYVANVHSVRVCAELMSARADAGDWGCWCAAVRSAAHGVRRRCRESPAAAADVDFGLCSRAALCVRPCGVQVRGRLGVCPV